MVFHRILDFKTGLDVHPGPFFMPTLQNGNEKKLIRLFEAR